MMELRDYQEMAKRRTQDRVAQGHRPIICAACGSGKTVISADYARERLEQGKRILWMTGRQEIIKQAYRTFSAQCGARNVGVLCAGLKGETPWWFYPPVTLASWDTLKARWDRSDVWKIPADVVLVDEAHLSLSPKMAATIMPHYARTAEEIVGFTATPARRSGRGLGSFYTRIIQVRSVRQLQEEGYLAPCEYWAGSHADTSKIAVDPKTGDFKERDLAAAHRDGVLIGDVLTNFLRIASERHTIGFAVDIAHAQALCEKFQAAGIDSEVIHSKMARRTRDDISEQFRRRAFQVLWNVGIATYGYDVPEVECVIAARPTRSIVLWHQMIGRGIRPKPDGGYCIVIDHGDNVRRLGCIEDEIRWRLDEGREAAVNTTREGDESRKKPPEAKPTECGECHYVFTRSRICPKCGWEKPITARDVETIEADLVKVRKAQATKAKEFPEPREFFLMLRHEQERKRRSFGWALNSYRDRFGELPPKAWNRLPTIEPNAPVRGWITSRLIAWKHERAKAEARV